jgi:DNA-binding SARP family transcriptional activator/DNA-binding CsgD family transcriptional regulator
MEVSVLGPLRVTDGDRAIDIEPKERALLATLAVHRGHSVTDDALIDALWTHPPVTARKTLQGHIHRLRRVLGKDTIVRDGSGYRLTDLPMDLDAVQGLLNDARQLVLGGSHQQARESFTRARERFRGRPVPELDDEPAIEGFRRQAAELESCVHEEAIENELMCGNDAAAIGELERLVGRDRARERAWCLLVGALAGCGRRADALSAVARARRALAEELGIGPGPRLIELERFVLDQQAMPGCAIEGDTIGSARRARRSELPGSLMAIDDEAQFVGRATERSALDRAFASVSDQARSRVELIVGEAGVGKTRLAAELARGVYDRGALVLFGRCSEHAGTPYEPIEQIVRQLREALLTEGTSHAVVGQAAALLTRLVGTGDGIDEDLSASTLHRLLDQIATVLAVAAATRPIVVVLDDLHWAARPVLLALEHLARHSGRAQLLIVGTVRDPEHGGADVLGALGAVPGIGVIPLGGLALDEVHQLVAASTIDQNKITRNDSLAGLLLARTGGNPFLLSELVRYGADEIGPGTAVPDVVREVVVARARRLPEPALRLLQIGALIGLEFEMDVVIGASGALTAACIDALDAGVRAQLISEERQPRFVYRFRHALIREALAHSVSLASQAFLHVEIARTIERTEPERGPAVITRLAHHLLLGPDREARAEGGALAERVGDTSLAGFAYDEAADWYERAIEAWTEESGAERGGRLHLALAQAATLRGAETRARAAATTAWTLARQANDLDMAASAALLHAGEPELNVIGDEPGQEMLTVTLAHPGCIGPARARVMARLGSALSFTDHQRAVTLAIEALEIARRRGEPADIAYTMRCRLRGWFDPDRVQERLAMAVELTEIGIILGDPVTESWGWRWQSVTQFETGDMPAIEAACTEVARLGASARLPNQIWSAVMRLAAVRLVQGRFDDSAFLLAEAKTIGQGLDNAVATGIPTEVAKTLAWLRGEPIEKTSWSPVLARNLLIGRPLWNRSDNEQVLDEIAANPDPTFAADIDRLEAIASIALAVRSTPHAGAAAVAYPFAQRHADVICVVCPGAVMMGSMHLYAGLLASAAGQPESAIDHLRQAVAVNERIGALPFLALSLHELAKVTEGEESGRNLDESRRLACLLGIPWLTGPPDGNAEPANATATEPGANRLTAAEHRVAEWATTGAATKAIARELSISVKTVEYHLGRIYRKLGVANRRELIVALLRSEVDEQHQ